VTGRLESGRRETGLRQTERPAIERVETERLVLERLRPEHLDDLYALHSHPAVVPTLWARPEPPTRRQVRDQLQAKVEHWERFGFGYWLARARRTGEMVGRGGPQHTYVGELHGIEVGWAIVPERWGQGLATELAQACVEVAFDHLDLLEIVAFTLPTNLASRRVMEKSGFVYERDIIHVGLPHVLYRRRRPPDPLLP
jgi:RimJ/RimL family protein N-acetyltransferase